MLIPFGLCLCFLITNFGAEEEGLTSASTKAAMLHTVIGALSENTIFKSTFDHPLLNVVNVTMGMRDEIESAPTFFGGIPGLHSQRGCGRSKSLFSIGRPQLDRNERDQLTC